MILAALVKELKLLSRDLHGLAVLFVMPIVFMLIMSVALSRDDDPHINSHIALLGKPDNALNIAFAKALRSQKVVVESLPEAALAKAKEDLQQGRYQMLVVNPNLSDGLLSKEQPLQLLLPPDTEPSWLLAMKGVLRRYYTETRLNAYFDHNSHVVIDTKGMPVMMKKKITKSVNQATKKRFDAITDYLALPMMTEHYLNRNGAEVVKPNAVQHSVPAWLIFGMFFIMIPLSNVMALERQTNTITRLRLARASAGALIASKLLPYFLINQLQFVGMLLLGHYLLPYLGVPILSLTGSWLDYAVLSVSTSLAALGYALLVSVNARSTEHAVVLGGGGIILMAALGGIMVPAYVMPAMMQQLTWVSPMAWSLSAFQTLLLKQAGLESILLYLKLLWAFAAMCIAIAVWCYRQQLKKQVRF